MHKELMFAEEYRIREYPELGGSPRIMESNSCPCTGQWKEIGNSDLLGEEEG